MFCSTCGSSRSESANFCETCGADFKKIGNKDGQNSGGMPLTFEQYVEKKSNGAEDESFPGMAKRKSAERNLAIGVAKTKRRKKDEIVKVQ